MIPLGFGWWMLWPYPCLLFAILISCRLNLWLMTRYWQLGRIGWNQSQCQIDHHIANFSFTDQYGIALRNAYQIILGDSFVR